MEFTSNVSSIKTEIILRAYWGAILLQSIIFIALPVLFLIAQASPVVKTLAVLGSSILAFYMTAQVAVQKFGFKNDLIIYTDNQRWFWPITRTLQLSSVNQILFGQLNKADEEAVRLGWPAPKTTVGVLGINRIKQYFLILTNDKQAIAVPTQAFSKKDWEKFMDKAQAAGIVIKVL